MECRILYTLYHTTPSFSPTLLQLCIASIIRRSRPTLHVLGGLDMYKSWNDPSSLMQITFQNFRNMSDLACSTIYLLLVPDEEMHSLHHQTLEVSLKAKRLACTVCGGKLGTSRNLRRCGFLNTMQGRLNVDCGSVGPMLLLLCKLSAFARISEDDSIIE